MSNRKGTGFGVYLLAILIAFMAYQAFTLFSEDDVAAAPNAPNVQAKELGGANNILIALMQREEGKEIYNKAFLKALYEATTVISTKIDGIDPSQVSSLYSTRYIELVEGGLNDGPVIPDEYDHEKGQPHFFPIIKDNVIKSGIVGRLVAIDHGGAMIEINPRTQEGIDYETVDRQLEVLIREDIEKRYPDISVHILSFAKVVQDLEEQNATNINAK